MTNYPFFKVPKSIEDVKNEQIPVPEEPTPPTKPYKETTSAWSFLVLLIPLLLIQVHLEVSSETILFTGGIGIIFIVIYSIKLTIRENKTHKENLKTYKKQLENFKTKLEEYKEQIKKIRNPEATRDFRKKRIKEEILNTTLPWGENHNKNKGYSEDYFFQYLSNRFPNNIYRDIILEDFGSDRSYQPDFIFQDQDTYLHIDIEVDEPYTMNSKEPIHFLKDNIHSDQERDTFFNDNGWIVIHFAEEQVIKFPESCCDYIAKIIYFLTEKNDWMLSRHLELPKVKVWTYEESLKLIEQNIREEYIKEKKTPPALYYNRNKPEILLIDSFSYEDECEEISNEYDDELPF